MNGGFHHQTSQKMANPARPKMDNLGENRRNQPFFE
jgi:hypothetical protein